MTTDGANLFTQGDKSQAESILPFQHPTSNPPVSYTHKNVYCHRTLTRGFYCARFPPQKCLSKKLPLLLLLWQATPSTAAPTWPFTTRKTHAKCYPSKGPTPVFSVPPAKRQFLTQNLKKNPKDVASTIWMI